LSLKLYHIIEKEQPVKKPLENAEGKNFIFLTPPTPEKFELTATRFCPMSAFPVCTKGEKEEKKR
jgi:hypothetical protein